MAFQGGGAGANQIRDKLDFSQVLFEQILQITRQGHNSEAMDNNVVILEITLSPYHDETYLTARQKLETWKNEQVRLIMAAGDRFSPNTNPHIAGYSEQKFGLLMQLARRKGLLPVESIPHTFGEAL